MLIFFILFVLVGSSNAVNLTDGLDGLAAGLSVIAFGVYGMIAWSSSWLSGYDSIAIFCFILVGGLLGFLAFNSYPAKIFMGDCGALSLGACLGGNGTLIGASANVIVAGIASREGRAISFLRFLIWSIPVMVMSVLVSGVFLYIKYFI